MVEVLKTIVRVIPLNDWEPGQWNSLHRSCKSMNKFLKDIQLNKHFQSFRKDLSDDHYMESVWSEKLCSWLGYDLYIWKRADRNGGQRQILHIWYDNYGLLLSVSADFQGTDINIVIPYLLALTHPN